jgi:hypothetical protein
MQRHGCQQGSLAVTAKHSGHGLRRFLSMGCSCYDELGQSVAATSDTVGEGRPRRCGQGKWAAGIQGTSCAQGRPSLLGT